MMPFESQLQQPPLPSPADEIYTCSVCQKGFEKRASRDRHTRRCRNKRPEDTIPRKKSCNHCASSKARCDQRRPACTRCRTKGLGCQYAHHAPVPPPEQHRPHQPQHPLAMGQLDDMGFTDPLMLGDVDMNMGDGGDIFAGWGQSCTEPQQLTRAPQERHTSHSLFLPQHADQQIQPFGTPSLTLTSSSSSSPTSPYPEFDLPGSFYYNEPPIERAIAVLDSSSPDTSVLARPAHASYPQVDLISRLLSSFVALLKKPTTAPPFIHKTRLVQRAEPLANATALVHMTSVKSPENKTFVSSMILAEFFRLEKSLTGPDAEVGGWGALEKFQAMVVLALVRLFDGEMESRELGAFEQCSARVGFEGLFVRDMPSKEETWDQWLLAESKRRTFSTVLLLDRIYHYRKGLTPFSCDGMGAVQLPASRSVWEAQTEAQWRDENAAVRTFPGWTGGPEDWLTLQELWDGGQRMGVWYAGIDALGTAMMADAVVRVGGAMKEVREGNRKRGVHCNF